MLTASARVWLAGAATLAVATGLAVLGSSSLVGLTGDALPLRLVWAGSALALLAAAWLTLIPRDRAVLSAVVALLALAWIAPVIVGWHEGPSFIRVTSRAVAVFITPLLLHLVLLRRGTRMPRARHIAVLTVYGATAALSAFTLLTRDAFYDARCSTDCDLAPLLPGAARWTIAVAPYVGLGITLAALVIGVVSVAVDSRRRAVTAPQVAAIASLALTTAAAASALLLPVSGELRVPVTTWLVCGVAVCLTALAGTIGAAEARSARRAGRVERLAAQLRRMPEESSAESALAGLLRDDSVRVAFPLGSSGALIDARGHQTEMAQSPHRRQLEIRRSGLTIALVDVDATRADVDALSEPLGSAATIAIDNERLHAEILAHLAELTSSRERIVDAADSARLRTERDLHDNAQSALVGLLYSLIAVSRSRPPEWTKSDVELLDELATGVRQLVTRLREVAHGVYPADLANTGIDEAVRTLVDRGAVRAELVIALETRPPERVERLLYVATKRLLESEDEPISLEISGTFESVRLRCAGRGIPPGLADRVAALDGTLTVRDDVIVMDVPCG